MEYGLTYDKLLDMLHYADRNGIMYEVYVARNHNDPLDGYHFDWEPLTVAVALQLNDHKIRVANFRTAESLYGIREPRGRPVLLYKARKTGKKYNHVKPIDLYKKDDSFEDDYYGSGDY